VIESTLVSLDGVIGDPQMWAEPYFNEEAGELALKQLLVSDAMLMGRRTYELFAAMWPAATGAYADRMNGIRKYVFSSTLQTAEWSNSTIIGGDVAAAVGYAEPATRPRLPARRRRRLLGRDPTSVEAFLRRKHALG
jgi:dihydrofolate reductase